VSSSTCAKRSKRGIVLKSLLLLDTQCILFKEISLFFPVHESARLIQVDRVCVFYLSSSPFIHRAPPLFWRERESVCLKRDPYLLSGKRSLSSIRQGLGRAAARGSCWVTHTWCKRGVIFIDLLLQKTPIIIGSFAERDLHSASYALSPPCIHILTDDTGLFGKGLFSRQKAL